MTVQFEGVRNFGDGTHYVGAVSPALTKAWKDRDEDNEFVYAVARSIQNVDSGETEVHWYPVTLVPGEPIPGEYKPIRLPTDERTVPETADERAAREQAERDERRRALEAELADIDSKSVRKEVVEDQGFRVNSPTDAPVNTVSDSGAPSVPAPPTFPFRDRGGDV